MVSISMAFGPLVLRQLRAKPISLYYKTPSRKKRIIYQNKPKCNVLFWDFLKRRAKSRDS